MSHLKSKTAVITGASRGIGAATARHFAAEGANVDLAARTTAEIEAIAEEIRGAGGAAAAIACDVSRYEDVEAVMALADTAFGGVDFLINNAGVIDPISHLETSDPDGWAQAIDINVKGVYYGLRAALPRMKAAGAGVVVNISSGAATSALEGWSHYNASKAAVLSITRTADKELGDSPVRSVGLSPGTVATEMQVLIKASGINPVSQLDPSVHIPTDWPARAIGWLCGPDAAEYRGDDVSLRDEDIRRRVGLID